MVTAIWRRSCIEADAIPLTVSVMEEIATIPIIAIAMIISIREKPESGSIVR